MKNNYSSLDVAIMVALVRRRVLGTRLANVYDLGPRNYLLRLQKKNTKVLLLCESGVRFHPTGTIFFYFFFFLLFILFCFRVDIDFFFLSEVDVRLRSSPLLSPLSDWGAL